MKYLHETGEFIMENFFKMKENNKIGPKQEVFKELNKKIGGVMKEKIKDMSYDIVARHINIEVIKTLPESERGDFEISGENKITESEINNYLENTGKKDIKILERDNGRESIKLPYCITKSQICRYLAGTTVIPIPVLMAFCNIAKIPLDEFMAEVYKSNNVEAEQDKFRALKKFMRLEFDSNDNYAFDFNSENKAHFINGFLSDEKELRLSIAFLSTHDAIAEDYQNGSLVFTKDDEYNICRVSMVLENNSSNAQAVYSGFAVFLNLDLDYSTCVCFLHRKDETPGGITTIQFRLIKNHNTHKEWLARNAFLLTTRSRDRRTLMHKMILTKFSLKEDELGYLKGYIRMNTGEIRIPKNIYDFTNKYLFNENVEDNPVLLKNIKQHFGKYFEDADKKSDALEAFENLMLHSPDPEETVVISYKDNLNKKWLKKSPLLTSWFRRNEIAENYHRLFYEGDDDINKLLSIINKKHSVDFNSLENFENQNEGN